MIEYVARNGPPEAMLCPALVCDSCRRQVTGEGNILWASRYVGNRDEGRQVTPMFVSHKGHCDQRVTAMMHRGWPPDDYDAPDANVGDGWSYSWEEAETMLAQLAHNFTHPFAADREPGVEYIYGRPGPPV
jgi:hypothetical protein